MAFSTNQITITGTGSLSIPSMPTASSLTNIVVFDSSSGQFSYTSSSAIVESGTWEPTLNGADGVCSLPTLDKAQYSRVGNIVNCTITGTVKLDFTTFGDGKFNFTYPFAPSTNNSIGVVSKRASSNIFINGYVRFNEIWFESVTGNDLGTTQFFAIFQYEID